MRYFVELILIFVHSVICVSFSSLPEIIVSLSNGNKVFNFTPTPSSKFPNVLIGSGVSGSNVIHLRIQNTLIEEISAEELKLLPNLETIEIVSNKKLKKVEENTFKWNRRLTYIDLSDNSIDYIAAGVFDGLFQKETSIGELLLSSNQLLEIPSINGQVPGLKKLYLDDNPIQDLRQDSFTNMTQLSHLSLRKTKIPMIPAKIFQTSPDIILLDMENTKELVTIHDEAFVGCRLLKLILNGTSIHHLPSKGLSFLKELHLANTPNLWEIPDNIVALPSLQLVRVSSSQRFLCCAFEMKRSLTGIHISIDSEKERLKYFELCTITTTPSSSAKVIHTDFLPTKDSMNGMTTEDPFDNFDKSFGGKKKRKKRRSTFDDFLPRNESITTRPKIDKNTDFIDPNFVTSIIDHKNHRIICDTLTNGKIHYNDLQPVTCTPEPDALRPCDDIMGNVFLTALSWLVSIIALVGNSMVFSVLILSRRSFTVTKFLLLNLSFADLLLALYLFILVSASSHTHGKYYNYVRSWQYTGGCSLSGFLAIFSSQLSILILVVVTVERYFAIVYAMHFHRRVTMKHAKLAISICWLVSIILALLPLVGVNSYEEVALCLPFKVARTGDLTYVGLLLFTDLVFFILVLLAYVRMYWVVRSPHLESGPRRNDSEVAKRMALLVFTDFFCWGPIAFVGLISAFGYQEYLDMNVKKSKYLLVIFFPINALCNPFLYAVSTNTFKRDFFDLLIRCGVCNDVISKVNEGLYANSNSMGNRRSIPHSETVLLHSQVSCNSIGSKEKSLFKKPHQRKKKISGNIPLLVTPPENAIVYDTVFDGDKIIETDENDSNTVPDSFITDERLETNFTSAVVLSKKESEYDNVNKNVESRDIDVDKCMDYRNNNRYNNLRNEDYNCQNVLSDERNSENIKLDQKVDNDHLENTGAKHHCISLGLDDGNLKQYDLSQEAFRKSPETPM